MIILPELLLASSSPRRHQILNNVGLKHLVAPSNATEATPTAHFIREVTESNALLKAKGAVIKDGKESFIIVGADTLVVIDNKVLGKPQSVSDARQMLQMLSAKTHSVFTGVSLLSSCGKSLCWSEESRVVFKKLEPGLIENYLTTNEPYDKAGSYAVQGMACIFIEKIEGSFTNVMGLPIESLLLRLTAFSNIDLHHWFQKYEC